MPTVVLKLYKFDLNANSSFKSYLPDGTTDNTATIRFPL